jgi:uncharacterized protein YbcI
MEHTIVRSGTARRTAPVVDRGRDRLCELVDEITGVKTLALFTDIGTYVGERVMVFTLDRDLETAFQ